MRLIYNLPLQKLVHLVHLTGKFAVMMKDENGTRGVERLLRADQRCQDYDRKTVKDHRP
jgi:hypothetical protein